ncbi:MAG: DNA-directed DNA polymerase II small subunit [Promethearchaeota archaeon]|nr:MAG: DNA-directed DNA polymerase II small subunit [Candidatus Lokiarchaeota archaeon]
MDEAAVNELNTGINKLILKKFVDSGINITPVILDFISNLENPLEKVNLIIKETSFIPTFNGHLTEHILNMISNHEIQKALQRVSIKEQKPQNSETFNEILDEKTNSKGYNDINEQIENHSARIIQTKAFETIDAEIEPNHSFIESLPKPQKSTELRKQKEIKFKPTESAKSSLKFNPSAKEYSFDYEILKDPTGKIYTNGDYNDFYELTVDKFNRLRNLMRKRGDTLSATNINNVFRNTQSQEISFIGLVKEIRKTKNGNYFLTLEDDTGQINTIVRKDTENREIISTLEKTIMDQMLFIDGVYNPDEKGKKGIVFSNNLTKIDIPINFKPEFSPDPLSIALISDTHIGSREFEKKLWNKFIKFLNGKNGDKNMRETAGRIKYIVLNGDLIDGIGVYPNQENDLIITDIYQQYDNAANLLSKIPDYIQIFYSSGNHEPVRNAIPRPAVPKKYAEVLINNGIKCIGNPAIIKTHNVNTLIFHGDSIIDMNQLIPGLDNNKPIDTMKELLICRHLAPIYGKKTQIAPINKDWLVIDKIPEIFHTGHLHIFGMGKYHEVSLVNSGCFQSQTDFMKSFGINPTPGIVPIIHLDTLEPRPIDFNHH